jgi:hypothetical protein
LWLEVWNEMPGVALDSSSLVPYCTALHCNLSTLYYKKGLLVSWHNLLLLLLLLLLVDVKRWRRERGRELERQRAGRRSGIETCRHLFVVSSSTLEPRSSRPPTKNTRRQHKIFFEQRRSDAIVGQQTSRNSRSRITEINIRKYDSRTSTGTSTTQHHQSSWTHTYNTIFAVLVHSRLVPVG